MAVDDVLRLIEKGKIKGGFGEIARRLRESEGYTRGRLAIELYGNKGYSGTIFGTEMGHRVASGSLINMYLSYFSISRKYLPQIIKADVEWYGRRIMELAVARQESAMLRRQKKLQKLL